ncbi:MAG: hypothetical protein JRJ85_14650 [Deltaproteobacteria bacterium]|nr:hypothetical protein [Deltaproteobacteria bacterium]
MPQQKLKRKQYIVDPEFQYGLIRKIAILAGLMVLMSFAFLALVHYFYGDIRLEIIQPDPFDSSAGIKTIQENKTLTELLWPVLAGCLFVTVVVTFLYGVLISHRMAGPIFRLRRILSEMAEGELRGDVRIRKKDDFQHLADTINELKTHLRTSFETLRNLCSDIESGDPGWQKAQLIEMKKMLSKFKTG